jgi:organic radical activating enzyme
MIEKNKKFVPIKERLGKDYPTIKDLKKLSSKINNINKIKEKGYKLAMKTNKSIYYQNNEPSESIIRTDKNGKVISRGYLADKNFINDILNNKNIWTSSNTKYNAKEIKKEYGIK